MKPSILFAITIIAVAAVTQVWADPLDNYGDKTTSQEHLSQEAQKAGSTLQQFSGQPDDQEYNDAKTAAKAIYPSCPECQQRYIDDLRGSSPQAIKDLAAFYIGNGKSGQIQNTPAQQ